MARGNYRVPHSEQRAYERLVSRANSRIRANLAYIQQENINKEQTQRSLLGQYADRSEWHNDKVTFHNRVRFESKKDYDQYKRQLEKWGGVETGKKKGNRYEILTPESSVEGRREGYIAAITKSLTDSAIHNNITLENGRLPNNIKAKINSLTLDQLAHFYENNEPVADLEYLAYSEVDFNGVTRDGFVEQIDTIINSIKQIFPANDNARAYYRMLNEGIDANDALRKLFPAATPHQIGYYRSTGNIPKQYTAPKRKRKKKK